MGSSDGSIIIYLILATFACVIAFAIYQRVRASKAKRDNEHSAMTAGTPAARAGGPGVPPRD